VNKYLKTEADGEQPNKLLPLNEYAGRCDQFGRCSLFEERSMFSAIRGCRLGL
jgi:hypothetical protein